MKTILLRDHYFEKIRLFHHKLELAKFNNRACDTIEWQISIDDYFLAFHGTATRCSCTCTSLTSQPHKKLRRYFYRVRCYDKSRFIRLGSTILQTDRYTDRYVKLIKPLSFWVKHIRYAPRRTQIVYLLKKYLSWIFVCFLCNAY